VSAVGTLQGLSGRTRMVVLPQIRHWVIWPLLLAVVTLAVGLTLKSVRALTAADLGVDQAFSRDHSPVVTSLALAASTLFSPAGGVVMIAVLSLFLLFVRRSPVNAVATGAVASAGWLSSEVFKVLVARHRPEAAALFDPLVPEPGTGSFPGGHSAPAFPACGGGGGSR
jgi:hypothetical protein